MRYKIVIIEDERLLGKNILRFLSQRYQCDLFETVEKAQQWIQSNQTDLILSDIRLPLKSGMDLLQWVQQKQLQIPVILITAFSSVKKAVEAIKNGAADYISKPFDLDELELIIHRVLLNQELVEELNYHRQKQRKTVKNYFVGRSPKFYEIEEIIQRLIQIEKKTGEVPSVLITGETGTGKGVLARRLHHMSPRAEGPFIDLNCTSVTETMFESELFGHEKGAFTGAISKRVGLFELAEKGTLFLDEIGHSPLTTQAKLLKVIEEKMVRRVGGNQDIPIVARLIAATNIDLQQAIVNHTFRKDLYHRLAMLCIALPSLRECQQDIEPFARFFLEQAKHKYQSSSPSLSDENIKDLKKYSWPGNIRELCNEIERSVLLYKGSRLQFGYLHNLTATPPQKNGLDHDFMRTFQRVDIGLQEVEGRVIEQALLQTKKNITRAAQLLNVTRDMLRYRIKKDGVNLEKLKSWSCPIPKEGIDLNSFEKKIIEQTLLQANNNVSKAARMLNISRETLRYRIEKSQLNLG